MPKRVLVTILLSIQSITAECIAQGESAVPFLLISPYAEANGMGEASVAVLTDDPLGLMTNPAHLGMQSQTSYFSFGHNYTDWLPQFHQSDLWLRTLSFTAGLNLRRVLEGGPPLSFGLAYSRVYFNLGEFIRTGPGGPQEIGRFRAWESSDQLSFGLGVDYWIKASLGITYKIVTSQLSPFDTNGQSMAAAKAKLFDLGLLIDIPVTRILYSLYQPVELLPSVSPFFDFSIGLARNNLGQESLTYSDAAHADPLPRYARAGIGFDLGFAYSKEGNEWKPLSFKWTVEANDILVKRYAELRDPQGNIIRQAHSEYQSGLGDIDFFDDVILGHTNRQIVKKKGWECNFLEVLSIRAGRFEEDPAFGNRNFTTTGWGVQFAGIVKVLGLLNMRVDSEDVIGFIVNHIDVRYNHSAIHADENHPLSNTMFDSFNIVVSN
jgi:hypothetical protein